MPFADCLASFKNSRVYARSATVAADTNIFDTQIAGAGGSPNGNTIARPANPYRTYLQLRNESTTQDLRYGYEDRVNLDTTGFLLKAGEAIIIDSLQEIYTVVDSASVGPIPSAWEEGIG